MCLFFFSWCFDWPGLLLVNLLLILQHLAKCVCGKFLSRFYLLSPPLLHFSFSSDHPFCRATFLKCWVRVVPDAWTLRGPSTRSCLLYSHWSSWLFTGKQNDPRGTRDVLPMDRPPLACVCDTLQQLQIENAMASFYASGKPGRASSCKGKPAFLQSTNHSVSHSNPKSGKTF